MERFAPETQIKAEEGHNDETDHDEGIHYQKYRSGHCEAATRI
jgi:hypothetical protein